MLWLTNSNSRPNLQFVLWPNEHAQWCFTGQTPPTKTFSAMFLPNPCGAGRFEWGKILNIHWFPCIMLICLVSIVRGWMGDSKECKFGHCQCISYELWEKNLVPRYKCASISDCPKVSRCRFWSDLATSNSYGCGQCWPHLGELFIAEKRFPQKFDELTERHFIGQGMSHYQKMNEENKVHDFEIV